jgi:23S rRNA (guanosine2251-2'-O)-methyltransferase
MTEPRVILGFNAVLGALEAPMRGLDRVFILRGRGGRRFREVVEACRRAGVPIAEVERSRLERLSGGGRHQGVVGLASAAAYTPLESLIRACDPEGRLVLLDGVQDPRNLGAVIRAAAAVGARGLVIPEHRAAGLTASAERAAAGTLATLAVARCRNIADLARVLRDERFWVAGLDAGGERPWDQLEYPRRMALVVGGEARGLRPRVRATCDATIAIPLAPGVESLNLSVAAAVVLYEALRQDRAGQKKDK